MLKKSLSIVFMFILVFAFAALAGAQEKKEMKEMKGQKEMMADMTTITGTLVDMKCYAGMGVKTNDHGDMKNCGAMCAQGGIPVGIVDESGHVYILGVPSSAYASLVGQELRLGGMAGKYAKDLFIPKTLEVKEDGKWVEKKLPKTMM